VTDERVNEAWLRVPEGTPFKYALETLGCRLLIKHEIEYL